LSVHLWEIAIISVKKISNSIKTLFNIKGREIRKGIGCSVVLNIFGKEIREGIGTKVVLNVKGNEIR
jgi:hypothetical protein